MDQVKIGRFIKQKRKENVITQSELAEKLNVTDRAISKWENGICMPDSGIIPSLCKMLNITINDLFNGEIIEKNNKEKSLEKNLLEMKKLKEESDKKILCMEILIGMISVIPVFISIITILVFSMKESLESIIVGTSLIPLLVATPFALKIEQTVGYYECKKCKHRYIPTYQSVFFAMHMGRTRYMKCPECNRYSWNKKVLTRGKEND